MKRLPFSSEGLPTGLSAVGGQEGPGMVSNTKKIVKQKTTASRRVVLRFLNTLYQIQS